MQISKYVDRDAWLAARRGKITGTRLKDIIVKRGSSPKIGFYELIAERLATEPDDENVMERGIRLEEDAIARFVKETGKNIDTSLVIWARDDNDDIAISPDGFIGTTEAVEVKCLSSARHIEAYLTKKVPADYEMQALQYFIVNDELQTLTFVFYDPRLTVKDYHTITITRDEVEEQVATYLSYEKQVLDDVNRVVNELTF